VFLSPPPPWHPEIEQESPPSEKIELEEKGKGICLSLIKVILEFMIKKISKDQIPAKSNERGERARVATIIEEIIE